METSILLGLLAGVLQVLGYVIYNVKTSRGDIKPNTASWAIWSFGSVLNLASYAAMTQDWAKDILPFACASACLATFGISLWRGHFGRPDKSDWVLLGIDCVITVVWFFTSATEANLLYQVGTVLSFLPIIRGIQSGKDKEDKMPWIVWTSAYAIFAISVAMRLGSWTDLVYPVTCFVMHLALAVLASTNHPSRKKS